MTMLETQHRLFELPFSICEVSSLARLMLWKIRIALDRHGPAEARRLSIGTSGSIEQPRDDNRSPLIPLS